MVLLLLSFQHFCIIIAVHLKDLSPLAHVSLAGSNWKMAVKEPLNILDSDDLSNISHNHYQHFSKALTSLTMIVTVVDHICSNI